MLHYWLHLWHSMGIYVGICGVVFFLPDATRAMLKKQFPKAAGFYLLCALLWGFGVGPRLISWLALLGLAAFYLGMQLYSQRREKNKNQSA